MAEKLQSKVTADLKKNRLCITIASTATQTELKKVYTDIRFCVADLKPGFDVITDLSRCTIGHLSGLAIFKRIMDYLVVNKVGRVVRIVGGTNIVFKQLLAIATKFQSYKPMYAATLQEAEKALLVPVEPEDLCFQINRRDVEYSIASENEKGQLVDISTNGCTVQGATTALAIDQELSMTISLYREQHEVSSLAMKAKVVSLSEDRFAVEFPELEQDRKEELYQCLVSEVRRDMAQEPISSPRIPND
ncbi:PilZ domain-containing protein [uncultured Desulfobulbus sp.]|uniref:PilZ domain-containing protein n=1 Tax=uncultured Desulfobulbus sp. TaxID=239745 RepID=UPI0029C8E1F7|nr:PilZ domain-containing protein [uncultured Desulfobulbus sp.]